jgi:hypothetical protein
MDVASFRKWAIEEHVLSNIDAFAVKSVTIEYYDPNHGYYDINKIASFDIVYECDMFKCTLHWDAATDENTVTDLEPNFGLLTDLSPSTGQPILPSHRRLHDIADTITDAIDDFMSL